MGMIKKLAEQLISQKTTEAEAAPLRALFWTYGALGAAAGVAGVGVAIKSFVDRISALERKMDLLKSILAEEERKAVERQQLAEARELLNRIEIAKSRVNRHERKEEERERYEETLRKLVQEYQNKS